MVAKAEHEPLVRLEFDNRAQSSIIYADGGEQSCNTESDDGISNQNNKSHGSSVIQTALNMMKMCMGTGTLALPFAAEKGGLIFNVVGLALIASWNYYCSNCVLRCRECLPPRIKRGDSESDIERSSAGQQQLYGSVEGQEDLAQQSNKTKPPPDGTTSYAAVAWYAAGPVGLLVVDLLMLLLMVMLIIAYEVAMISFIDDMPTITGSRKIDIIIPSVIVALLSCSPDVSFLSKFSVVGLLALALSFIVIVWQGLMENGLTGFQSELNLWPRNVTDASSWFGVAVFGYGIAPFILNFHESMKAPKQVGLAMKMGLILVYFGYIIISSGVRILFSPSHSFDGDVLQALPTNSWLALLVRLLMTFVVAMTAPLVVVPCGEMIEGKLGITGDEVYKRIAVRVLLCMLCMIISEHAPGFVHVVSFIGCFCASIIGFVLPPLFCIQLRHKTRKDDVSKMDFISYCDLSALVIGIITTILTSTMTFGEMRRSQ